MTSYKKVFFLGIGGIGISALARLLKGEGAEVIGSNINENEITSELKKEGIAIMIGQDANMIPSDVNLVVYTNAIKRYDPALLVEVKKKHTALSYPELLGEISRDYRVIAVSGTHGKTTTTGMIGSVLIDLGFSPNIIVGSLLVREKTNFIKGSSDFLVVEADEYERAFLNLNPEILVINNVDLDHLDYYRDLFDIQSAFRQLVARVPETGSIICNPNSENVKPIVDNISTKIIDYTAVSGEGIKLKFPGEHNILNAKVALTVAELLNLDRGQAVLALNNFEGTWRRFEYKGETKNGAVVYDDYAHNPQKIKAAISGTREKFPDKKILTIFHPHLFSRTKLLFNDFVGSFSGSDSVIVAPIFAAREHDDGTVSNKTMAEAILKSGVTALAIDSFGTIEDYVNENFDNGWVVLTVGAGDINKVAEALVR